MIPEIPKTFSKLQLPPINKKNQISMVEMVLLVVIIVLFYWFVISPKKAELTSYQNNIKKLQDEKTKVDTDKAALQAAINSMNSDPDSVAKLNESLPFNGKTMALQLIVQKLATESGVTLGALGFSAAGEGVTAGNRELINDPYASKRTLKKIMGNVSVTGQVDQIQAFLVKLEESGRIFDLTDMQVSANPEGGLQMAAALSAYYYAP